MTIFGWLALILIAWAAMLVPLHYWFVHRWSVRSDRARQFDRRVNRFLAPRW